jgi:hypothetical protein
MECKDEEKQHPRYEEACERDLAEIRKGNYNFEGIGWDGLTYEERVRWFVTNYYETGMEYEGMLHALKDVDLDNFKWYDEVIKFPKYKHEIKKS